jgi:protein-S-isoprenylcysteine O-methyltransferase Ste14
MAVLALILTIAWLLIVGGVRGFIQYRRMGQAPLRIRVQSGSWQWWARVVSVLAVLLALGAPIAELAGVAPFGALDQPAVRASGIVLVVVGIVGTLGSQLAMGDSWRGDVDPEARTPLVTSGPFRLVRNPVLTSTAVTALGLALMVPNVLALAMVVACVIAWQVQVRKVEEPYLLAVHGDEYRRYAARTGRFVPGIGRLGTDAGRSDDSGPTS